MLLHSGWPVGKSPDSEIRITTLQGHGAYVKQRPGTSCLSLYEITNTNSQQTVGLDLAGHSTYAAKDSPPLKS